MKIVVLDGYTMNPGDLSWEPLAALGDLTVYERTPVAETVARAAGAQVVLTNKVLLTREVIAQLPDLRFVGVLATGYNVVDLTAADERGIPVSNVPAYSTPSVAQLTFALLLELCNHVGRHADSVRAGGWSSSADFSYTLSPQIELAGKTMGLIGLGRIGRSVATIAQAFGMTVIAHTRTVSDPPPGVRMVDLDTVFREADVVSLHCPLTADNTGMVNADRLAMMRPSAVLLNTGRGPLVDEAALAEALTTGRIAGAAMDVLSAEPPAADNPLLTAPNCVITPHIAWATGAARQRLMGVVVDNVRAFIAGRPQHVVNRPISG